MEEIISEGDLDYIAMDIKAPLVNYKKVSAFLGKDIEKKIKKSIELIIKSGINYEFRTTVNRPQHRPEDFEKIGRLY